MRAILRRILLPLVTTGMASSTPNPKRPTLHSLIPSLRLYKPPPTAPHGGDDRGTVFSQLGLVESAAAPLTEKFGPKRAAVLVCLFEGEELGDLRVVLTKRSSNLSTHSGEVSLPGGKAEEGDADDEATAVREAEEEIGLDPKLVTVVTVLEPFLSKHYTNLQTGKWFRSKEEVLQDLDNEKQQVGFMTDSTPTSNTVAAKVRAWKPESDVGASRKQQG